MPSETEDSLQPKLIVIAGPNGAGKTTLTERALAHEWLEGCDYINPDQIAKEKYGDWNDPQAVLSAAREAGRRRNLCLEQGRSFAFETVFSTVGRQHPVLAIRISRQCRCAETWNCSKDRYAHGAGPAAPSLVAITYNLLKNKYIF